MWIILKNAEEVTETYKKVTQLQLKVEEQVRQLNHEWDLVASLKDKIYGLELENETLQREVEHWKLKAQFNKDEVTQ